VILADTSIWIDHLRGRKTEMQKLLSVGQIVMHPFIVAEIALGSLKHRHKTFALMESLWQVRLAELSEVRKMIEGHRLYSKGLGLTDAHLIASCLLTPGTQLWTRDSALDKAAKSLGIQANVS
jgi:predicted nucleic acid-binding protein